LVKKAIPHLGDRSLARAIEVAEHSAAWSSQGFLKKVTIVQDEDIKLLRRIVAGGGRKYTAGNVDRSRYDRLVDLGWLTPFKTNINDVEYQVTEKGRAASLDNADD
jgi:hypothetical protein